MESGIDLLLKFAERLPECDKEEHRERIRHCKRFGHLFILKEEGIIKGYAETYVVSKVPAFPAVPWPKNEPDETYLYCYAAVCDQGYLRKLINMGKLAFPDLKFIFWHRAKRGNKLRKERVSYV